MKSKQNTVDWQKHGRESTWREQGFTLIELLVVIAIMVILTTTIVINFNMQRGVRNLRIGQNELVTNIRKVQNYVLSARNISTGVAAQYYVVRFAPATTTTYIMEGIDSSYNYYQNLETFRLPQGISIQRVEVDTGSGYATVTCAQVAFRAPFGKVYINSTNPCSSEFTNTAVDPALLVVQANRKVRITLATATGQTKTVEIKGLSGTVITN